MKKLLSVVILSYAFNAVCISQGWDQFVHVPKSMLWPKIITLTPEQLAKLKVVVTEETDKERAKAAFKDLPESVRCVMDLKKLEGNEITVQVALRKIKGLRDSLVRPIDILPAILSACLKEKQLAAECERIKQLHVASEENVAALSKELLRASDRVKALENSVVEQRADCEQNLEKARREFVDLSKVYNQARIAQALLKNMLKKVETERDNVIKESDVVKNAFQVERNSLNDQINQWSLGNSRLQEAMKLADQNKLALESACAQSAKKLRNTRFGLLIAVGACLYELGNRVSTSQGAFVTWFKEQASKNS